VVPSLSSPADLAGKFELRRRRRLADVGIALAISKPGALPGVIVCRACSIVDGV
jgi:hypothetical protein